jgi:hypothetical protein
MKTSVQRVFVRMSLDGKTFRHENAINGFLGVRRSSLLANSSERKEDVSSW